MIDIHSHILPEVDDGAHSLEDSVRMAKLAMQEGIHQIIATPHHMNGSYNNIKLDIIQKVNELNEAFSANGIELKVYPGQELRIYGELIEDFNNNEILTLNNADTHLLIEFPSANVPRYAEKILYDIQMKGITPIIVHPERNRELVENPTKLYEFVKKGALTQVTAGSIAGKLGKNVQKFSLQLIESNLTHFVASDAHNTDSRPYYMSKAMKIIQNEFSIDMADLFFYNAEQLMNNKAIHKEIPVRIKKKKFLGLF